MNVFQYSHVVERNWKANLPDMTDYEPKYTFYADFAIAEFCEVYMHDKNAVKKTFEGIKKSWGGSIKAITEVAIVLNHKSWAFASKVDSKYLGVGDDTAERFQELYTNLYYELDEWISKKFAKDADAKFDTALCYEPSLLKKYAYPLFTAVKPDDEYYEEVMRLRSILDRYEVIVDDRGIEADSIIREFIGGSSIK